jgi:hypothetical protein
MRVSWAVLTSITGRDWHVDKRRFRITTFLIIVLVRGIFVKVRILRWGRTLSFNIHVAIHIDNGAESQMVVGLRGKLVRLRGKWVGWRGNLIELGWMVVGGVVVGVVGLRGRLSVWSSEVSGSWGSIYSGGRVRK